MSWLTQSLVALISFSFMSILITSQTRKGIPVDFSMFIVSIIWIISFPTLTFTKYGTETVFKWLSSPLVIMPLIIASLLSVVGNILQFNAQSQAPNPGLAMAIVGCQSALIALIAIPALKDKLTLSQGFGIFVIVIGIAIVSTGTKN